MSILLRLVSTLTTMRYGKKIQMGNDHDPFEMAMNDDCVRGDITIAASGSAELFDGSETDPFTTASVVWVRSDRDCVVQLTFDTTGTYGKEVATLAVKGTGEAGVLGHPLSLSDARGYANYTEDFAAGTLVNCDRVTIKNTDATYEAKVEYFIGD